jgi:hypothetical protein
MSARRSTKLRLVVLSSVCVVSLVAAGLASGKPTNGDVASTTNATTSPATAAPLVTPAADASNDPGASSQSGDTAGVKVGSVSLTNQTWECKQAVNLDSVTVTITTGSTLAVALTKGCTGTIKNITVVTSASDGIHVNSGAHDITVSGGSITCSGHAANVHQDGVQVMSGTHVTFSNLRVNCPTANNAAFFVNWSGVPGTAAPSNVVCTSCFLYGTQSSTAFVTDNQTGSGLKTSTLCPSRYFTYRKGSTAKAIDSADSYPRSC